MKKRIKLRDLTNMTKKSNYSVYIPQEIKKHDQDTKSDGSFKKSCKTMSNIVKDFIKDFEGNYVMDGKIVDDPHPMLVRYYKKFKEL